MTTLTIQSSVLLLVMTASVAGAQRFANPSSQQIANAEARCQAGTAEQLTSRDANTQRRAMGIAKNCPDAGGALLAEKWRNPPTDSAVLRELVFHSTHLIDARLADAALETLRNRSSSLAVRVAALTALVTQINPGIDVVFGPLRTRRLVPLVAGQQALEEEFVMTSTSTPPLLQTRGKQPVSESVKARLKAALRGFERESDDKYLLLAIKEALLIVEITPGAAAPS